MPDADFLEKYPLYKKFEVSVSSTLDNIPEPTIHLYCEKCKSEQTFKMEGRYYCNQSYSNSASGGEVVLARYLCAGCEGFIRSFLIKISEECDYVMKVGQQPPWDISIDKNLEKTLGEHSKLFKKGLICESQGYGVGAYAYYRRIVELIIDELLNSISDLIGGEEKVKYKEALEKSKKTKIAQEKIELVKDLLPPLLRPDNMNPLSVLHEILSKGIHEKTDEECMELAESIKQILSFLVNQITVSRESSKKFTEGMRKVLEKKKTS